MKRTFFIGCLLVLNASVFGQTSNVYNSSFVKISSDLTDEPAIGLIIYESSDSLYIVSPRAHVILSESNLASNIKVQFKGLKDTYQYEFYKYGSEEKFAFIRGKKPSGFSWQPHIIKGTLRRGSKTSMLDTADLWKTSPKRFQGLISQGGDNLKADFRGTSIPSTSGNILFKKNRIAGVVTGSNREEITGISLDMLQSYAKGSMGINDRRMFTPIISFGIIGSWPVYTFAPEAIPTLAGGFYIETGFTRFLALRYTMQKYRFESQDVPVDEDYYKFRNKFNGHHFLLSANIDSSILDFMFIHMLVGYSLLDIEPKLSINFGPMLPYTQVTGVPTPKKTGGISFGFDSRSISYKGFSFGALLMFTRPFSEFVWVNPAKGLNENLRKD